MVSYKDSTSKQGEMKIWSVCSWNLIFWYSTLYSGKRVIIQIKYFSRELNGILNYSKEEFIFLVNCFFQSSVVLRSQNYLLSSPSTFFKRYVLLHFTSTTRKGCFNISACLKYRSAQLIYDIMFSHVCKTGNSFPFMSRWSDWCSNMFYNPPSNLHYHGSALDSLQKCR